MINMKNLFETKKWDTDNLRLICGDLYACMNGQQWVLLWNDANKFNLIYDCDILLISSDDGTFTIRIKEDRRVEVYSEFDFLRYITFDEMVDRTYSKFFNDDSDQVVKYKDIARMLNAATKTNSQCIDDIFSTTGTSMLANVCVYDEILFVNVSGNKWYPIFTDIACAYDRNGDGIGVVNQIPFPSRVIIPNKKHRTLDIFRIIGDELKHVAIYDKEHIKLRANSVRESHGWKMIHYLFESELNRDVNETTLYADNKPYMTLDEDDWGEPEKEETVYIKEYEDGIEAKVQVKEGFTGLWNKIRKDILGIKTPSERFEWNKYIDDFEAKWNHDMLKAHLNEKLVSDNVHAPEHYKLRGLDIEAIDVIRGALTKDEFRGFCKGNVLKYTIREGHKNGDEDLKKAKKYLDFLEKDDSDE